MALDDSLDNIVTTDGRAFLRSTHEKFDLIIVDVYNQAYIPFHLTTEEFFSLAGQRLTPRGVLVMNVAWRTSREWDFPKACANTLKKVFPTVYFQMFNTRTNTLLYATHDKTDYKVVSARLASPGNRYIKELVSGGIDLFNVYPGDPNGIVFTDDRAPVEFFTDMAIRNIFGQRDSGNI